MKLSKPDLPRSQAGYIVTTESLLICTISVLGLISGLTSMRDEFNHEMFDVAQMIDAKREQKQQQQYAFGNAGSSSTSTSGQPSYVLTAIPAQPEGQFDITLRDESDQIGSGGSGATNPPVDPPVDPPPEPTSVLDDIIVTLDAQSASLLGLTDDAITARQCIDLAGPGINYNIYLDSSGGASFTGTCDVYAAPFNLAPTPADYETIEFINVYDQLSNEYGPLISLEDCVSRLPGSGSAAAYMTDQDQQSGGNLRGNCSINL